MTVRRLILLVALIAGAWATAAAASPDPPVHARAAATCAEYANQADAQRAADTRDPDHDGIYCEDNPCPCSSAWYAQHGGGGGGSSNAPTQTRRPRRRHVGPTIKLGRVTRHSGCHVRGALPDPRCTPGAYYANATKRRICRAGYASGVRHVTRPAKDAVYREYGMSREFDGVDGEVDHLVPLELGGSNVRANLFPESAAGSRGSHQKDRLENRLHDEVCAGRIGLRHAQRLISTQWVSAYDAQFG